MSAQPRNNIVLATHLPTRIATELAVTDVINIKLATHLPTRIATGKRYESPCIRHCLATHLPMRIATNDWRSLKLTVELATHLYTRIATTYEALANMYKWTGNPLVYEDCNCKIFVICECYGTKDLLSYGGKCKKVLTRRKSTGSDFHNILLSYKFTLNLQH